METGEKEDNQTQTFKSETIGADVSIKELTKVDVNDDTQMEFISGKNDHENEKRDHIVVHTLETLEVCVHEVALPPNVEYKPLKKTTNKPAKEYKFLLDPFQKEAILCIQNNESVLVSAHTSAGKTVVAEYSVAQALKWKEKVIYTTPIKALSNQKYREFYEEFKDVGLVTGDVTISPNASCLIMTTEILRSMLYRGSSVMKEVSWVIFDEIHYMRDKERGVVWEEAIILLPDNVHYVFLSATIPNARQFAEWVAWVHHQPCHVVYTDYRPTPLQHYVFPAGSDGIHLIIDEKGEFLEENFNKAMKLFGSADNEIGDQKPYRQKPETDLFKMVKMVMERNLSPAIIFSFSKKECESNAMQMAALDFLSSHQKTLVDEVFNSAMQILSEEDRILPQVQQVLPLLRRGIGIHHGGLLPILKETIEILFAEGLVKALFATETFAMGLNMPARTVIFTSMRKYDGYEYRFISSGEYIQMSGRAGRRGIDEKGIVILMIDEKVSASMGKMILRGKADPLNSAFHLTFNMILNLVRVEGINPEYMMERSFFQFQNLSKIPILEERLKQLTLLYNQMVFEDEYNLGVHYRFYMLKKKYYAEIFNPKTALPYVRRGRLVKVVRDLFDETEWGIILSCGQDITENEGSKNDVEMSVEVGIPGKKQEDGSRTLTVKTYFLSNIRVLSSVQLKSFSDIDKKDSKKKLCKLIEKVTSRFPEGVPELDPLHDLRVGGQSLMILQDEIRILEKHIKTQEMYKSSRFQSQFTNYLNKKKLEAEISGVKSEIETAQSLSQLDELKKRKRVLRRLGYFSDSEIITVKGRVSCEVNIVDNLLIAEALFSGMLYSLQLSTAVALLSVFLCDMRNSEHQPSANMKPHLQRLKEIGNNVERVCNEAGLNLEENQCLQNPVLVDAVCAWCNGVTFFEVCKMTDVYEGNIIRCFRRLEELLRQLVQASKSMGSPEMECKFSEGICLMKRDIVFAASLYL